jgi:hypothetical protein
MGTLLSATPVTGWAQALEAWLPVHLQVKHTVGTRTMKKSKDCESKEQGYRTRCHKSTSGVFRSTT